MSSDPAIGLITIASGPIVAAQKIKKQRPDSLCKVSVKGAADRDSVIPGRALIAPGNLHMMLKCSGARYFVQIKQGPLVCRHSPSVDVLFRSVACYAGMNSIGIFMTGMGGDGSRCMAEMKNAGAYNLAQDEESCVVFSMPNEAIKRNAVDKIVQLQNLPVDMMKIYKTRK